MLDSILRVIGLILLRILLMGLPAAFEPFYDEKKHLSSWRHFLPWIARCAPRSLRDFRVGMRAPRPVLPLRAARTSRNAKYSFAWAQFCLHLNLNPAERCVSGVPGVIKIQMKSMIMNSK
jgi:hypothetical protein